MNIKISSKPDSLGAFAAFGLVLALSTAGCSDSGKSNNVAQTDPRKCASIYSQSKPVSADDIAKAKGALSYASSSDIAEAAEDAWNEKNFELAVALAQMAIDKDGNSAATYRLGTAYFCGYGTEKNNQKALDFLNKPSQAGVRYAQYYRGLILSDSSFAGKDLVKARKELETAKAAGVKEADAALTTMPNN